MLLALLTALVLALPFHATADPADEPTPAAPEIQVTNRIADTLTLGNWNDTFADNSTHNVGRIWTDKSVSADTITFTATASGTTYSVSKDEDADFLVALSAVSSTSNVSVTTNKPLDIVLVLDVSGSMGNSLGYTYNPVYVSGYSRGTYYVLVDGEYEQVSSEWSQGGRRWYYYGDGWNRIYVTPISSASDDDSSHVQFYQRTSNTKLDALQDAASAFIDATAALNEDILDPSRQHRVAVVKFAGTDTDAVGNGTYREGGYEYNYSQVVSDFVMCSGSAATSLKNSINSIDDGGATSADYGLEHATDLLNGDASRGFEGARDGAQKVVIFFTDGQPNHYDGFDEKVAADSVNLAHALKDGDTLIYTVGLFSDANASDTTGQFNEYMHAVSSNYPDASADSSNDITLGDRAADSSYYKVATDAASLSNIFSEIADDIQRAAAGYPTTVTEGAADTSGYVTFTDELGAYMEVVGFEAVTIGGQTFANPTKSTDGLTDTYTFSGTVGTSDGLLTDGVGLGNLVITVQRSGDLSQGDVVTVEVPASLIPLDKYTVDTTADGATTMGVAKYDPIRVYYSVGLKPGTAAVVEQPDAVMQAYLAANLDEETGEAAFYSNDWSDATLGQTTAEFTPSTNNNYYYFTSDTPVYTDEACTQPLTTAPVDGATYYYVFTYYNTTDTGATRVTEVEAIAGQARAAAYWKQDESGNWYIPAGMQRLSVPEQMAREKASNETGTASMRISPAWSITADGAEVVVHLGNNGKMTVAMPGSLSITKAVEIADEETMAADELAAVTAVLENTSFAFVVQLQNADGSELTETYQAYVTDGSSDPIQQALVYDDTVQGYRVSLKPGQTIRIVGLPDNGTTYTVYEDTTGLAARGLTLTGAESSADGDTVSDKTIVSGDGTEAPSQQVAGTVVAGGNTAVTFTNTYKAAPATLDGATSLQVQKILEGLNVWPSEYTFTFLITALNNGPLPDSATVAIGAPGAADDTDGTDVLDDAVASIENTGAFGDITFTEPGTYYYRIQEATGSLVGVTYSQAIYRVTVVVTDDGNGALDATATMVCVTDDGGVAVADGGAVEMAAFTNVYAAAEAQWTPTASKAYTDNSGAYRLADGMFSFELIPFGENAATAPMPIGTTGEGANRSYTVTNVGRSASFGQIAYGSEDIGATYQYLISEINGSITGMTYDKTEYLVDVTVGSETVTVGGEEVAAVKLSYAYYKIGVSGGDGREWEQIVTTDGSNPVVFRNAYNVESVTLDGETAVAGQKTLVGRSMNEGEFAFTLSAADTATKAALESGIIVPAEGALTATAPAASKDGSGNAVGTFSFGAITFTKVGTYTFNVNETTPAASGAGLTLDTHTSTVTVTVTDLDAAGDHTGKLTAQVTYSNAAATTDADCAVTDRAAFTNVYTSSLSYADAGPLNVTKVLHGYAMPQNKFTFTITAAAESELGVANAALESKFQSQLGNRDASFGNAAAADGQTVTMNKLAGLLFDQDDDGKVLYFWVEEKVDVPMQGYAFDAAPVALVSIEVVDNGDGTMRTVTTVKKGVTRAAVLAGGEGVSVTSVDSSTGQKASVDFVNSYAADVPATLGSVSFQKAIDGRDWLENDSFTFTLAADPSSSTVSTEELQRSLANVETTATVTGPDANSTLATFSFTGFEFYATGTYAYTVTENGAGATVNGLTYSNEVAKIVVHVYDDGTGALKHETPTITGLGKLNTYWTFTNTYSSSEATLAAGTLYGTKTLTNGALSAGDFTFKLEATGDTVAAVEDGTVVMVCDADGNPLPDTSVTVTNDANGSFSFGAITFAQPGTYTFAISEVNDGKAGVTYDNTFHAVAVVVTDNLDGTMTASVQGGVPEGGYGFTNTYGDTATASTTIEGTKTLTGRAITDNMFEFELWTVDADRVLVEKVSTGTVNADGTFTIATPTYTMADMGDVESNTDGKRTKDIAYAVRETNKGAKGFTYDDTVFSVTVTLTDDGEGNLTATATLPEGGIAFANSYASGATVSATIEGVKVFQDMPQDGSLAGFNFTLVQVDDNGNATLDGAYQSTAVSDENGNFSFTVPYTVADLAGVTFGEGGTRSRTFTYLVSEVQGELFGVRYDTSELVVRVTLTDDGQGNLSTEVSYLDSATNYLTFTNVYDTSSVTFTPSGSKWTSALEQTTEDKAWEALSFGFEVLDADGNRVSYGTSGANGDISFSSFVVPGEGTYSYTIREVAGTAATIAYDGTVYNLTLTVERVGNGEYSIVPTYRLASTGEVVEKVVFQNVYDGGTTSIELSAQKTIEGPHALDGFLFNVTDLATGEQVAVGTSDASGAVKFSSISYSYRTVTSEESVEDEDGEKEPGEGEGESGETNPDEVGEDEEGDGEPGADNAGDDGVDDADSSDGDVSGDAGDGGASDAGSEAPEIGESDADNNMGGDSGDSADVPAGEQPAGPAEGAGSDDEGGFADAGSEGVGDSDSEPVDAEPSDDPAAVDADEPQALSLDDEGVAVDAAMLLDPFAPGTAIADDEGTQPFDVQPFSDTDPTDPAGGDSEGEDPADPDPSNDDSFGGEVVPTLESTDLGEHWYRIAEVDNGLPGVTYDQTTYLVQVLVTDPGTGSLQAQVAQVIEVSPDGTQTPRNGLQDVVFRNGYKADQPVSVQVEGTKTLTGRDAASKEFSFKVLDAQGQVVAGGQSNAAAAGEAQAITFGQFQLTEAGEYDFTVVEDNAGTTSSTGVTYDSAVFSVHVSVTDNGDGTLSAAVTYPDGPVAFQNTYKASNEVTVDLEATKTLTGRAMNAGEFSFEVVDNATGAVVANGSNRAAEAGEAAAIDLGTLFFSEAGTYSYTVRELNGGAVQNGVAYDAAEFPVAVTVTDNLDGTLSAQVAYPEGGIAFVNAYSTAGATASVTPTATKTLTGRDLVAGEFTFVVRDPATGEAVSTGSNDAAGNVSFASIEFTEPGTYEYVVNEVAGREDGMTYDLNTFRLVVIVTDNLNGTLSAQAAYPDGIPAFVNAYAEPQKPVEPSEPAQPNIPKTGDATPGGIVVAALAGAGVLMVGAGGVYVLRRKRAK